MSFEFFTNDWPVVPPTGSSVTPPPEPNPAAAADLDTSVGKFTMLEVVVENVPPKVRQASPEV